MFTEIKTLVSLEVNIHINPVTGVTFAIRTLTPD
jgi:hypothetical protein